MSMVSRDQAPPHPKHPFHLSLPVYDLDKTRDFYVNVLGQREMRSAMNWVDFDFFGHQLSVVLVRGKTERVESIVIDGDQVPIRHFGMILPYTTWETFKQRLLSQKQTFVIGPRLRFAGKEGEQGTMFVTDPSGNYLEFKYFTDTSWGPWY